MTDAQFDRLVALLTDIRDGIAYLCQPAEVEPESVECEHAEAQRTDLSTPGEVHWICGACGHVERRLSLTRAPAFSPSASAEE